MAVSVEALVFIVIGRSCSEGCEFDSHYRPGSFLRFNSRRIMYGAVGSLVLSWSWTRHPGFIFFWCHWIQLCNNLGQKVMSIQFALANQAIHPFGVSKFVPAISRG